MGFVDMDSYRLNAVHYNFRRDRFYFYENGDQHEQV